jgi:predicted LPLAT superfamily acyltransferase/glycosyltransferase involved in cell wall biosynthesis
MILRYLIVLPCYNNSSTINAAIEDVLDTTSFPVLVIDDGSDRPVIDHLKSEKVVEAISSGRVAVVRHDANRGKGAALQTAFAWALKNNKTHVISFDSDGQHLASEVGKLVEESRKFPWSLIIGSRRFEDNVPGISKFGRTFSNFWVNYESGHKALDSQSGFRIYPLFYVQNLSFFTRKYDFEIEVLIRLLWNNVDVREVEVDVYYPPAHLRISHFDKFWDNLRISLLNCVLVIVSLLRGHTQSWKSSLALGLGVFIGCTPLFGVHTFIATLVAFVFRLNLLFLFVGTNISIPPIAPLLAFASITIGHILLGESTSLLQMPTSFEEALLQSKTFFTQWFLGSIVVGISLGVFVGGVSYFLKSTFAKKSKAAWTGKTRGGVIGNGFLKLVLKYLGRRPGYFCLLFIIPYFYIFAPRARHALNQYWSSVDNSMSWMKRQKHILKHFYVFGQVLMDRVFQSYNEDLKFKIDNEGPIYFPDVQASKRGWVFIGAHLGGWDISTLFFKKSPESARLAMVHYLSEGLNFDKLISRSSESASKVDSIQSQSNDGSLLKVKSYLENQMHVGFLTDRAMGTQVELILFLGKLAPFETRPFRVAAACRAPMIFTYSFKREDDKYLFVSSNYKELQYSRTQDKNLDVFGWTENFVKDLECQVRRFPLQWFNFYPFWSSLPLGMQHDSLKRTDTHLLEELNTPPMSSPDRVDSTVQHVTPPL